MPPRKPIEIEDRFGAWTVLGCDHERTKRYGAVTYACRCDCGKESFIQGSRLWNGKGLRCQSCALKESRTTHGESKGEGQSPEYRSWQAMLRRCDDPNHIGSEHYLGRGIKVCEEWQGSGGYEVFLAHVGRRPTLKHTIDRIDSDGDYEPGNVRWATMKEQSRNKRNNRLLTIGGETKCVADWVEVAVVAEDTLRARLRRGWSPREAVFTFVGGR